MKLHIRRSLLVAAVVAALPLAAQAAPPAKPLPVAKAEFQPKSIAWTPQIAYRSATLRISGPGGFVLDRDFADGKPVFDLASLPYLADGPYVYEIVLGAVPDENLAKAMSRAEFAEDGSISDPALAAKLAALRATLSGTFTIAEGKIVSPHLFEPRGAKATDGEKEYIHPENVLVQGSLCVGFNCATGESFGFDTIRLKEDNTRIKFEDTSTAAGFPTTDWQLTANDSASGGANKFSIEDITGAKVPFTVTAGAPTNSLFIDSGGRVGFRTATPVLDLHARTSNTPGIRLEQDSSGGFTAQTWDVAANEANFFIRDVTGGSRLPFRIRPGAATSSVDIAAAGVGINTGSPKTTLDVAGTVRATSQIPPTSGSGMELLFNAGKGYAVAYDRTALAYLPMVLQASSFLFNNRMDVTGTLRATSQVVPPSGSGIELLFAGGSGFLVAYDRTASTFLPMVLQASNLLVTSNMHVNGNLVVTGTCCAGPDYVFDPSFKVASIEENAAYMWKNRHLPAVGPAKTNTEGRPEINVLALSHGMLEEIEKAHIYIEQLHNEIKALKADAAEEREAFRRELAEIKKSLGK